MSSNSTFVAPQWAGLHRVSRWLRPVPFYLSMFGLLLFLMFASTLPFMVREVPAGQVGVVWRRLHGGTDVNIVLQEGIQLIYPWDKLYLYSTRLNEMKATYDTLSSNGLSMKVTASVRYQINTARVGELHKHVGPDYERVLVGPSVGAVAREVISQFTPEQLYTEDRVDFDARIVREMQKDEHGALINASGLSLGDLIQTSDVLIEGITLPATVAQAIERKAEQHQLMLEYQFRLAREDLERQRREIEAQGLRAYEAAMPNGIAQSYLVLRGIEATQELAKSPNSKIVMFGSQTTDLPFVLNSMLNAPQAASQEAAAPVAALPGQAPAAAPGAQQDAATPQPNRPAIATQMPRLLQRMNPLPPTSPPPVSAPLPPTTPLR